MSVPVLEFYTPDWLTIPHGVQAAHFRLIAKAPAAASIGIALFGKPTTPATGTEPQWAQIGKALIDNLPDSLPGSGISVPLKRGMDYVIRFEGQGHLLMPGFNTITVGFDLAQANGVPLTNFDGSRTANGRACGITGNAYLRCV